MANWGEYLEKSLNRLKRKSKAPSLPQLVPRTLAVLEEGELAVEHKRKREKQVKESLAYRLFEKMRRRSISWKSYFYQDEYGVPNIAITNDDATGIHINERQYLVPEEQVVEGTFYTDEEASKIFLTSEYLDNAPEELFNHLVDNEVSFQIYNKTYPLQILFQSDMDKKKGLFFLGHHKIYVKDKLTYLLRPIRNLGASGFYALTNRMLSQEGIPVDKKGFVESLLIELGNDELLRYYQSALNLYNRQASIQEASTIPDDDEIPLIITESKKATRRKKGSRGDTSYKQQSIPYESYELFAKVFERNFEEFEDDLLKISMTAIELNRAKASDELASLSDKLHQYTEEALLDDMDSAGLYNFMKRFSPDENENEIEEVTDYSLLEDEAYEQILIETMESIREICSDPIYGYYAPIRNKLDMLMETIESLYNALQDAFDKHKRREIDDRREILLKRPFELPNNRTYERDLEEGELSYYDKLLKVNETVRIIKEQMQYTTYYVAKSLTISGYILTQLENVKSIDLEQLSNRLLQLIEMLPSDDYASFESNFVQELALIASDVHEILNTELSEKLTIACANLASFQTSGEIYSEQEWIVAYTDFINKEVIEFNKEIRARAIERQKKIREEIFYLHKVVDIFIGGVSYPALLPATLHEEGEGLQTYLVQDLQEYLATQNLQIHTVPGREKQLRSLINELMQVRLDKPLKEIEYYFRLSTTA